MKIKSRKIKKKVLSIKRSRSLNNLIKLPVRYLPILGITYIFISIGSLYRQNFNEVRLGNFFAIFLIISLFITLLHLLVRVITASQFNASVVSLLLAIFIMDFESIASHYGLDLINYLIQTILLMVLVSAFIKIIEKNYRLSDVYKIITLVSLGLLLFNFIMVGWKYVGNINNLNYTIKDVQELNLSCDEGCDRPDIYYFVFDRYASEEVLKEVYDYKNPLIGYLKKRGFTINDSANSNYPFTHFSIPSVLNASYLDDYFDNNIKTIHPLKKAIDYSTASEALQNLGYEYYAVGSWWEQTRHVEGADVNYDEGVYFEFLNKKHYLSEFQTLILEKSIINKLATNSLHSGDFNILTSNNIEPYKKQFEKQKLALGQVIAEDTSSPKFVFSHILLPHPPFIYDENGNTPNYGPLSDDDGAKLEDKYVNQLKYANKYIEELFNAILENNPDSVIIMQADEGPYPKGFTKSSDYISASTKQRKTKTGISSYIYVPDKYEFNQTNWSPVNTFPLVFNSLFNTSFESKDPKVYLFSTAGERVDFSNELIESE